MSKSAASGLQDGGAFASRLSGATSFVPGAQLFSKGIAIGGTVLSGTGLLWELGNDFYYGRRLTPFKAGVKLFM
ncbi:MAG: hypothetical protein ACRCVU_19325, partial [Flavobacterium sp.]